VPDDLSIGELGRRLEAMRLDIKDDIRDLAGRLDGKVSSDVFKLEQAAQDAANAAVETRVTKLEDAKAQEARQRVNDRKLMLTALILPIVVVLVGLGAQVVLKVTGAL
jgi:hypothetical protein